MTEFAGAWSSSTEVLPVANMDQLILTSIGQTEFVSARPGLGNGIPGLDSWEGSVRSTGFEPADVGLSTF